MLLTEFQVSYSNWWMEWQSEWSPVGVKIKKGQHQGKFQPRDGSGVIQAASRFISIHCTTLSSMVLGINPRVRVLGKCSTTELPREPTGCSTGIPEFSPEGSCSIQNALGEQRSLIAASALSPDQTPDMFPKWSKTKLSHVGSNSLYEYSFLQYTMAKSHISVKQVSRCHAQSCQGTFLQAAMKPLYRRPSSPSALCRN